MNLSIVSVFSIYELCWCSGNCYLMHSPASEKSLFTAVLTMPSTEMHWPWSSTRPHTGVTCQVFYTHPLLDGSHIAFLQFSYFRIVFLLYSIWKSARYKQYLCQIIISNKNKDRYPTVANVESRGRKKSKVKLYLVKCSKMNQSKRDGVKFKQ